MEFLFSLFLLGVGSIAFKHFTNKARNNFKNTSYTSASTKPVPINTYLKNEPQPSNPTSNMPYILNSALLTNRELDLYHNLRYALKDTTYFIAIKPRIADFINVVINRQYDPSNFWHFFNPISAKHVDFLVCDEIMRPLLAIELDDSTHDTHERVKRDNFVNDVYSTVGLNVIRVREYTFESIRNLLSEFLLLNTSVSGIPV